MLVALSPDALTDLLSLDPTELKREEDLAAYLGGNKRLPGSETYAHCYAGHQFGAFSGQLGDGAAISLGKSLSGRLSRCFSGIVPLQDGRETFRLHASFSPLCTPVLTGEVVGEGRERCEIQLKGAGPTPYSRR